MIFKDYLLLGVQFVVFVGFTLFVYRGGFYDGSFSGYEEICGKGNVVLSENIYTHKEVVRCKIDSDFKKSNLAVSNINVSWGDLFDNSSKT